MRRMLALLAAVALLAAFTNGGAAIANAGPDQCRVTNKATNDTFGYLQDAVDGATAGDTLEVRGTCHGTTTIGIDLTIKGMGRQPTLDGDFGGSVLAITSAVDITIDRLTITGGGAADFLNGGGIHNQGTVTLNHSLITDNAASSRFGSGGGIYNGFGTMTLNHTTVSRNTADYGGGIDNSGTLKLDHSIVTDNTASGPGAGGGSGGGIENRGTVWLDHSTISKNNASFGGGIETLGLSSVTLDHSTITENTATRSGGGLGNRTDSVITINNSMISGNIASIAGGIDNWGTVTLERSTISGNRATDPDDPYGGGVTSHPGALMTLSNSTISGNTPNDCFAAS